MLRNKSNTHIEEEKSIKKFNYNSKNFVYSSSKQNERTELANYIYTNLVPNNNLSKQIEFSKIISDINSGNCVLFVDTLNIAFDIDAKGFKQRKLDALLLGRKVELRRKN